MQFSLFWSFSSAFLFDFHAAFVMPLNRKRIPVRYRYKVKRMSLIKTCRYFHELPYREIVNSGTVSLASRQILGCKITALYPCIGTHTVREVLSDFAVCDVKLYRCVCC